MKKRMTLLLLATLLLFGQTVLAAPRTQEEIEEKYLSDIVDMERVFKYDYTAIEEDLVLTEELIYSDAAHVAMALGLLKRQENGLFNEDGGVPFSEFAKIILRLNAGDTSVFDEAYEAYPTGRYATQNEVAHYLAMALGYGIYAGDSEAQWPLLSVAQSIGLLKKIDFTGDRNITRGELAQMMYNAFSVDMVVQTIYGEEYGEYEKIKGQTLLEERFDAFLVEGILSAQNGVDIYSVASTREDFVEIDRIPYRLNGLQPEDMLGHRVIAVAQDNGYGEQVLLGLHPAQADATLELDLADITYILDERLYYKTDDGEEVYVNLDGIERVIHNGEQVSVDALNADLVGREGIIRLCTESKRGDYTAAVVQAYSTFVIGGIASYSGKILLANSLSFGGESFIRTDDEKTITVFLDGEKTDISSLAVGQVISVIENPAKTNLVIQASSRKISGRVTALEDETVYVEDTPYTLSSAYEIIRSSDSSVHAVNVGYSGDFLLDYKGQIVRFARDSSSYIYGYLMAAKQEGGAMDPDTILRVFTVDNKFEVFTLADKLTMDGVADTTSEEAYAQIANRESTICYNPIRYQQNASGLITFLDTMYMSVHEDGDKSALRLAYTFSGTLNWTASTAYTSLPGTSYNWSATSQSFIIPTDKTEEKEYIYYPSSPKYATNQSVTVKLYNTDAYDRASLLIEDMPVSGAASYTTGYRYGLVLGTTSGVDEDGEIVTMLEMMDGTSAGTIPATKFSVDSDIRSRVLALKPGDIIQIAGKGSVVSDFKFICSGDDFLAAPKDMGTTCDDDRGEILGTIVSVDPAGNRVRVQTEVMEEGELITTQFTFRRQSSAIYDSATGRSQDVTIADFEVGDRVFCFGGVQLMRMIVVR